MYCPHCGTLNEPGAIRCTKCTALLLQPEKKNIWKLFYRPGQGIGCLLALAAIGIVSLSIIIPQYRLYNMQVNLARESIVKNNMRQLRVALDQMAVEYDQYPASLAPGNTGDEDQNLRYIASVVRKLPNPFDPQVPVVTESQADPPDWSSFKPGQIVYVPLDVSNGKAAGYAIYGVGKKGLLKEVLRGGY